MANSIQGSHERCEGVFVATSPEKSTQEIIAQIHRWLDRFGIHDWVQIESAVRQGSQGTRVRLNSASFERWTPDFNTIELAHKLAQQFGESAPNLFERETLLAMLATPVTFAYPSVEEWESSMNIRMNIARAAKKTFLSFDAYGAERPEEYWTYDEERGFLIQPGKPLIDALRLATQPGESGTVYSFSCYRATEYVVALGIAQEAQRVNPQLLRKLQVQAERRAIRSGEFHEVFMKEYGSREHPLPAKYYVPGDRVWFKNPDPESAEALGFEGSWLFYMGNGLFSDFWKRDKTFTLELKCLEIYHWRDSTYQDAEGIIRMDEKKVQERMRVTERSADEVAKVLQAMEKIQDGRGVYADGGCIDPSREYTRWVRPGTCDIRLADTADIE